MAAVDEKLTFVERATRLMERVEYRRADTPEDKERIFRMRHRAYAASHAIAPRPSEMFQDECDDLPNAWLIGVFIDGEIAGSIRIHIAAEPSASMPDLKGFSDVLSPLLASGHCIVNATRHVNRVEFSRQFPEMPLVTMRACFLAEQYFNADYIVGSSRAEHQNAFRRMLNLSPWTEPRNHPDLAGAWALMGYDCHKLRAATFARYPFYRYRGEEQRALFGRSSNSPQDARTALRKVESVEVETV
jgi:hypothetical protein